MITFSDDRPDYTIETEDFTAITSNSIVDIGEVGQAPQEITSKAILKWESGRNLVLQGEVPGSSEGTCEVSSSMCRIVWIRLILDFDFTPRA